MKQQGWTHRMKGLTGNPYLKVFRNDWYKFTNNIGATFTDEDQKFRFILWENVEEL